MLKWLLVIGVIAVVYYVFIKKSVPLSTGTKKRSEPKTPVDEDTMVPCEECGVYISVKEAFIKEGRYYCSKSCMDKH